MVEVTLSYAARPRRTRRTHKRYLSTWLSWKASGINETDEDFKHSIFKKEDESSSSRSGFDWCIRERNNWGEVRETNRTLGTLQKDWAKVKSYELPEVFNIAVVGHEGWDRNPQAFAKYSLVVSFEIINKEIPIYGDVKISVEQLIQSEVEAQVEVEV